MTEAFAIIALALAALAAAAAVWALTTKAKAVAAAISTASEARVRAEAAEQALASARADHAAARESLIAERDTARAESRESLDRVTDLTAKLAEARQQLTDLDHIKQQLEANEQRLKESFAALSADALKASKADLLQLAKEQFTAHRADSEQELEKRRLAVEQMVRPIRETLGKTDERLTRLDEQLAANTLTAANLREETGRLFKALSKPEVRGAYGEIQLKRVAELAGMTAYCDFTEQTSVRDEQGNLLRPDMVVKLPNDRVIAVDAKANLHAYLEALGAPDDAARNDQLDRFARHIAEQAKKLADKRYWSAFEHSPEFVVMFVPGDHFIDAALQRRPDLLDLAAQQNVILASPSTLIALLRAVAVGWRESTLAEEAKALLELGKELHDRAAVAFDHAAKLGDAIRQSVERYNRLVGSLDTRMVPTLKKFEEAGVTSGKALPEPTEVTVVTRSLDAAHQLTTENTPKSEPRA